jgi:NADH-quinone oxidoreductase subunit L
VQIEPAGRTGYWIAIPLVLLSILALTAGFVEIPPYMGDVPSFTNLMRTALPAPQTLPSAGPNLETKLSVVTDAIILLGVGVAYVSFYRRPAFLQSVIQLPVSAALAHFWETDWGNDKAAVRPFVLLAEADRSDVIDAFYTGLARPSEAAYRLLSASQTGRVRWYAAAIAAGFGIFVIITVFA